MPEDEQRPERELLEDGSIVVPVKDYGERKYTRIKLEPGDAEHAEWLALIHRERGRTGGGIRAWAMARQRLSFFVAVTVVLAGWALWLQIEENFYGHAVTLVGTVMLLALFVWNGENDPDRNHPIYSQWMGGGGS